MPGEGIEDLLQHGLPDRFADHRQHPQDALLVGTQTLVARVQLSRQ